MRLIAAISALAMIGVATPALAQSKSPPAAIAPVKTDVSDKMVCKAIATTGTRFVSHDCRTQAQWDQLAADSRQATQDMTSRQGGLGGH